MHQYFEFSSIPLTFIFCDRKKKLCKGWITRPDHRLVNMVKDCGLDAICHPVHCENFKNCTVNVNTGKLCKSVNIIIENPC